MNKNQFKNLRSSDYVPKKKTFILVIGAQKSGTSWLYRVLSQRKNINFGIAKEYHVWDALHIKACDRFDLRKQSVIYSYLKNLFKIPYQQLEVRKRMQKNDKYYFDYFRKVLEHSDFTGDITPSYAGLNSNNLDYIFQNFTELNIEVKVIFLLRDPFNRALSAFKMHTRNNRIEEVNNNLPFEDSFIEYFTSENCKFRTKYEATIESLMASTASKSFHIDSYESIFFDKNLHGLEGFLNLKIPDNALSKKFNFSPSSQIAKISEPTRKQFYDFYDTTYNYCRTNYPKLTNHWLNN